MIDGPSITIEQPVFFRAGQETLFGLLSEPAGVARDIAVIYLSGGTQGPSSGRDQRTARLCRELANDGFPAFRFDYRGVGDSTGAIDRFRLDRPFVEDALGAIDWLALQGFRRFVLVGSCFGARTAVSTATISRGVAGLVLLLPPIRDKEKDASGESNVVRERGLWWYALKALRPKVLARMARRDRRRAYLRFARRQIDAPRGRDPFAWVSQAFVSQVADVVDRGVPILFLRGTKEAAFADFDRALAGPLGDALQCDTSDVQIRVLDGRLGARADARVQDEVIAAVSSWLEALSATVGQS